MTSTDQNKSWPVWAAWAFWLVVFLVITVDIVRKPLDHTTVPTYQRAATHWWSGQDPYSEDQHAGFLYFPQAAIIYTPFGWGPPLSDFFTPKVAANANGLQTQPRVGEIFWRLAVFAFYAYALIRLGRIFLGQSRPFTARTFLLLSLLAAPSSLAALRNAQFDLPLATLLVMTAVEIAASRWNAATLWLCVAVALKPLAVVPLLLFGALYGKLLPRLGIGLVLTLLLPFLHWNPAFVAHEYVRCAQTLLRAGTDVNEPRYSDLAALLSHVGIVLPALLMTGLRVLCALGCLGLGILAVRRLNRIDAAWSIGALSADYLMLFNPRTETCSYVFLGPWIASLALLYAGRVGPKWLGWVLGFGALCLACDAFPKIPHLVDVHLLTDRWLKPLVALLFLPVLIRFILFKDDRDTSPFAAREYHGRQGTAVPNP